jgi:hypothetical protein
MRIALPLVLLLATTAFASHACRLSKRRASSTTVYAACKKITGEDLRASLVN